MTTIYPRFNGVLDEPCIFLHSWSISLPPSLSFSLSSQLSWLTDFYTLFHRIIVHGRLVSIQLCFVLSHPSFSSCIWSPLTTFLAPDPVSRYFWVALFLCGLTLSTVVLVWQCCHYFFSVYVPISSIYDITGISRILRGQQAQGQDHRCQGN